MSTRTNISSSGEILNASDLAKTMALMQKGKSGVPDSNPAHQFGLPQTLANLQSLLDAIDRKVLVLAHDIGGEQAAEIAREIGLMREAANEVQEQSGLWRGPGSLHLMRN